MGDCYDRAIAHINPENAASIRVSERLGMRFEGLVDFCGETTGLYVIERSTS
jgi:RimJ/RimL family protein N-acetyltransferase